MARLRWVGIGIAVVAAVAAVGILVGIAFGEADVDVTAVEVTGDTRPVSGGDCPAGIVRAVDVSVALSRGGLDPRNPQWWAVGVSVRASAFRGTETRVVTLAPGEKGGVTIPFTRVQDGPRAPREWVDVVVQVTTGNRELIRTTETATLDPVSPNGTCP